LIREVLPSRTRAIERRATHAVDQIWVCSDADARLMKDLHAPPAPIHVVCNGVDLESYGAARVRPPDCFEKVAPTERPLLFLGTFGYWPNQTAAIFLIEEVFPLLASRHPDSQLLLVGTMPTSRMLEAAKSDSRILVTGAVPDIRPYLAAASVLAVPLFEGGGTRFKILEALAAGVPVISTAKGAEGLQAEEGTHLLIAESADEFVDGVLRIWTNESLKNRLKLHGRDLVRECYSWPVAARQIRQALQPLIFTDCA
jgi:glycosyltransferase involved in cell wall biosynthesis